MTKATFFKHAEAILKPISLATMLSLPLFGLGHWLFDFVPPVWLARVLLPVLTAAAVGYLTNYVAIEMLFKPYSPADRHWLRLLSLGFWKQGLISANKAGIGQALGREIPRHLLNPDELSKELCDMATDLLHNRQLLDAARDQLVRLLPHYSRQAAASLMPYIDDALRTATRENLTPERLRRFWDELVGRWLADPKNVDQIAAAIVAELQSRGPELTDILRSNAKTMVQRYLKTKHEFIATILPIDTLAAGLVDSLDWRHIETQIADRLAAADTTAAIGGELTRLSLNIRQWLETPAAEARLEAFLAEARDQTEQFLRRYLEEKLPVFANQLLESGQLWEAIEQHVLPAAQTFITHYLKHNGRQVIIDKLNLSARIEAAIENQDVKAFHTMINALAAKHLGEIQVLGYFLGALAGLALLLANPL